jgi:hypothetical protein
MNQFKDPNYILQDSIQTGYSPFTGLCLITGECRTGERSTISAAVIIMLVVRIMKMIQEMRYIGLEFS